MKRAAAVLLIAAFGGSARAADCAGPVVSFNQIGVPADAQAWLADELRTAFDKVCAWWGPTFGGALTVDIRTADEPSMALVPAWRGQPGQMQFPGPTVQRRRAATIHEVVHVFAPNANRFLAEGLAVYAHEALGGPRAFPNFGRDLHAAAALTAPRIDIAALDRLPTPAMLGGGDNYLAAGSFVRFLIDRAGLDMFRRLYALTPLVPRERNAGTPGRWTDVYGAPLERLVADWRVTLAAPR